MRQELGCDMASSSPKEVCALQRNNDQKDFDGHKKYPLPVLVQEMDVLPPEINPLRREVGVCLTYHHKLHIINVFSTFL